MSEIRTIIIKILSNRVFFLLGFSVVVVIVMSSLSPYFLLPSNIEFMARYGTALALVGIGQSIVMISGLGGIDLSVGSMISLSSMILGLLFQQDVNAWLACLLVAIFGIGLGAFNGFTIALIGIPPLIGTLGTLYIYGTLALLINKGIPIGNFPPGFSFLGQGSILGIPTQLLLIVIPAFLVTYFILTKTELGRSVYLGGTNDLAARLAGIRTTRMRFLMYTTSGFLASLSGIIMSSWVMSARGNIGIDFEMQAITVASLGGIAGTGGLGSLLGTMLSVVIITMVSSGLQLANINTIWQLAVLGFILILSVAINQRIVKYKKIE